MNRILKMMTVYCEYLTNPVQLVFFGLGVKIINLLSGYYK